VDSRVFPACSASMKRTPVPIAATGSVDVLTGAFLDRVEAALVDDLGDEAGLLAVGW
jgi:hypothetical protein